MNFTTCICFSHKIPPHLHCSYPGSPGTLTWWVSSNFSCTWSFILPATSRWQLPKGHRVETRAPLSDTRPSISTRLPATMDICLFTGCFPNCDIGSLRAGWPAPEQRAQETLIECTADSVLPCLPSSPALAPAALHFTLRTPWNLQHLEQVVLRAFYLLLVYFNWKITALQGCPGFRHTSTQISHNYTCVHSLLSLPSTPTPIPPSRSSQGMEPSSLCNTAASH